MESLFENSEIDRTSGMAWGNKLSILQRLSIALQMATQNFVRSYNFIHILANTTQYAPSLIASVVRFWVG